jgi:uncharacterized membrane protein YkoI
MKRKLLPAAIAALVAVTLGGVGAYAANSNSRENDALAIAGAKVGLAQAIAAAEQQVGGKASKAEFEQHKGQMVFDIEVVKDHKVSDVKVDAATGKVLSVADDKADNDDEQDEKD